MRLVEKIVNYGHGYANPSYLAIHETSNPGASASNHVKLYSSGTWQYAVQYVCDWTETVYHCVPDDRKAWAVGNGNSRCVNLEICHATNQADFDRAYQTAVEFAAWYLDKRGWGMDRLISHDDARRMWGGTDHTDPIDYFREYGKSWQQFCSDVQSALGGSYTVKHEPVTDSTPQRSNGLLRKGDSGSAVRNLQSRLNALGYNCGAVDGIFGNRTRDAIRAFQRSAGLDDDGIAGPLTFAALDSGQAHGGGGLDVDGKWGKATTRALQRALGTTVDGIVSHQRPRYRDDGTLMACNYGSFEWTSSGSSPCIAALQRKVGANPDGVAGPATVRALQSFLGVGIDGKCGPATVRALQTLLRNGTL